MAEDIRDFCVDGLINLAGGCCGSTPPHIKAVAQVRFESNSFIVTRSL